MRIFVPIVTICVRGRHPIGCSTSTVFFDPIRVRRKILETCEPEIREDARRALLRNLLFAYAQLSENPQREYDSFRTRVREQLQGEREWFSLLSSRNRVLAWMICRAPWSFRLAYRTYVAVFRREEQH